MEGSSSGEMVNKSGQVESTSDRVVVDSIKYKGVRKRKWGKWVSEIRLPNSRERIWLGSYDSPVKAARAFDAAQFCLRGKSANFNFPHNPPEIPGGRSMTPAEIQAAASRFANMPVQSDREMIDLPQITTTTTTAEDESTSYSPSISDGATVQMDSDLGGVETSIYDQLTLSTSLGSGNFASDFGFLPGFDDFTNGNFYSPRPDNSFDYHNWTTTTIGGAGTEDHYDASFFQDCTSLWNFQI